MELKLYILQSVTNLLHLDLLFIFELGICVTCEKNCCVVLFILRSKQSE